MCVHTECHGYLQLQEIHDGDQQYLLPGEEFPYKCVKQCDPPNEIREQHYCEGESA